MTAHAQLYGHDVWWDEDHEVYRYVDNGDPIVAGSIPERPCPQCGKPPTPEGYDACLGYLPGVTSACCGHGRRPPCIIRANPGNVSPALP